MQSVPKIVVFFNKFHVLGELRCLFFSDIVALNENTTNMATFDGARFGLQWLSEDG